VIGLGAATRIHAQMTWTRLRRGRLLAVCGVLVALPIVAASALSLAGHWGRGLYDELLEVHFRFLLPFVPALLAAPAIADELERRTIGFVFMRPAPRAALVLGKWAATVVPVLAAQLLSVAGVYLISLARFPGDLAEQLPHLAATLAAVALGTVAFTALALALGTAFSRHPLVAVAAYLLIVEAGLGSAPILLNLAALSWHLRNLAGLPVPDVVFLVVHVPAAISALLVAAVAALCLLLASASVTSAEIGR
jgi:hypothetical protein